MPAHFSVASAIEKDKIASAVAFVLLLDIFVVDADLNPVTTLSIAKNSEAVVYQGTEYQPGNFSVGLQLDAQSAPSLSISAQDPTGYITDQMETYGGGVGFQVTMTVVNTGNLDQPPEVQESFQVVSANHQGWVVSFTLGVDNPVAIRFPYHLQFQDQCTYRYMGPRCKYSGDIATCDFTYSGANGCVFHDNAANFGGFLGLNNTNLGS